MSVPSILEQLKRQLKRGNFDDGLRVQTNNLWNQLQRSATHDENYYKAKSIVSEVSYYFDNIDLARQSVEDFSNFDVDGCSLDNQGLALEKIRCYLAHIQATHYYKDDYKEARLRIEQCLHFITTKLKNQQFSCSSTLAWANYQLGCCFRQLLLMERAEQAFVRSIGYQNQRARSRLARPRQMKSGDWNTEELRLRNYDELLFCNRRIAIVLGLGLGFCDLTRGYLSAAREKLMIARALIAPCNDRLNDAYLALLLGNVKRCLAGSEPAKLKRAAAMVQAARDDFESLGHARYSARAIYELALTHFALADQRHTFVMSFVGRPQFNFESKAWRYVVNNNQFGIIATANSGERYNIVAATDINFDGFTGSDNPVGFTRNSGTTPKQFNVDLRYSRFFNFTERFRLEAFAEFLNVFNINSVYQLNALSVTTDAQGSPTGTIPTVDFLRQTNRLTSLDSRQAQIGFKFIF